MSADQESLPPIVLWVSDFIHPLHYVASMGQTLYCTPSLVMTFSISELFPLPFKINLNSQLCYLERDKLIQILQLPLLNKTELMMSAT